MAIIRNGKLSTKDLVIDILSTNIELTAKKVYNKVRYLKNISYHAVFKILNQMLDQGILTKDEMNYSLNPKWISDKKDFFQKLDEQYKNRKESLLINKDSTQFVLPSIHEGFFMLMRAFERGVFGEYKIVVGHYAHLLYLQLTEEERDLLVRLSKNRQFYYLVNGDSTIDKMVEFYNRKTFGYKHKLGVNCADQFYLYATGDTIIQIQIPHDLREAMDRVYHHKFSAILYPKPKISQITTFINEVAYKKTKIYVHVIKNKEAAKEIIEKTLKYFG